MMDFPKKDILLNQWDLVLGHVGDFTEVFGKLFQRLPNTTPPMDLTEEACHSRLPLDTRMRNSRKHIAWVSEFPWSGSFRPRLWC
jgi:hypothetical protein